MAIRISVSLEYRESITDSTNTLLKYLPIYSQSTCCYFSPILNYPLNLKEFIFDKNTFSAIPSFLCPTKKIWNLLFRLTQQQVLIIIALQAVARSFNDSEVSPMLTLPQIQYDVDINDVWWSAWHLLHVMGLFSMTTLTHECTSKLRCRRRCRSHAGVLSMDDMSPRPHRRRRM